MAVGKPQRQGKRERSEQRRQAARRRVRGTRIRRTGIGALIVAVPALWFFDQTGPQERVSAEVTETKRWHHYTASNRSHQHVSATLSIEGLTETTLRRADGYVRGQRVPVWIQRGRLSGWPRFQDFVQPGEAEPSSEPEGDAETG